MYNDKKNGTELEENLIETELSKISGGRRELDDIHWGPFGDAHATCHSCGQRNVVYRKDYRNWRCFRCNNFINIEDVD